MLPADYIVDNARERTRLDALLETLSDEDLSLRLDNGLTIAAVLVHMAFWDDYCTELLRQWTLAGPIASRSNFEAVNGAILHLASVVAVDSARDLVRGAASVVDAQVEALSSGLAAALLDAKDSDVFLRRSIHRGLHLDQIEDAISTVRPGV